MTEKEQQFADMCCRCQQCGQYSLTITDGLCSDCLTEYLKEDTQ